MRNQPLSPAQLEAQLRANLAQQQLTPAQLATRLAAACTQVQQLRSAGAPLWGYEAQAALRLVAVLQALLEQK